MLEHHDSKFMGINFSLEYFSSIQYPAYQAALATPYIKGCLFKNHKIK